MRFEDLLAFSLIEGIGEKTLKKLHGLSDVSELSLMDDVQLSEYLPAGNVINIFRTKFDEYKEKMLTMHKKLSEDGALIVSLDNSLYPDRLLNSCNSPVFLYCIGNTELLLHTPAAAISGPRLASETGIANAAFTAKDLVSKNTVVISGMAKGIDASAHEAASDSGKTIAVLPFYTPVYPPQNKALYERILKNNGLVISEYFEPNNVKFQLLSRDRIIVNLAEKLFIPDSFKSDSGTAYTVKYALAQQKPVYILKGKKYVRLYEEP